MRAEAPWRTMATPIGGSMVRARRNGSSIGWRLTRCSSMHARLATNGTSGLSISGSTTRRSSCPGRRVDRASSGSTSCCRSCSCCKSSIRSSFDSTGSQQTTTRWRTTSAEGGLRRSTWPLQQRRLLLAVSLLVVSFLRARLCGFVWRQMQVAPWAPTCRCVSGCLARIDCSLLLDRLWTWRSTPCRCGQL